MKILLFGANGQVGHELRRSLAPLGVLVCTTRSGKLPDGASCEVADFDHPATLPGLIERIAPDIVVNAAAYTAVDRAEDDRDAAFRANAEAPAAIAESCSRRNALLVHYSTDYVFDGAATRPYREDHPPCPLGVYGASKLAGEQAVQASGARHMVFRTAWVYAPRGQNFFLTILRLAAERDVLRVVADQVGTPTPAGLIADVTAVTIANPPSGSGLWHLTARGCCSWYDFAQAIVVRASAAGLLSCAPEVVAIPSTDYPMRVRRPAYSCLDTSALQREFPVRLPEWEAGLTSVLAGLAR